jgi:hypothetical protein
VHVEQSQFVEITSIAKTKRPIRGAVFPSASPGRDRELPQQCRSSPNLLTFIVSSEDRVTEPTSSVLPRFPAAGPTPVASGTRAVRSQRLTLVRASDLATRDKHPTPRHGFASRAT